MIAPFEQEFQARLEAVQRDVDDAAAFGFTEFGMNHAAADSKIIDRLNLHPSFWIRIRAALHSAMFVAIGRLYDRRGDVHTARALLDYAKEHPGLFSAGALEARKVRFGFPPEVARQCAAEAPKITRQGFDAVEARLQQEQEFFDQKIGPIRHKVFAHAAKLTRIEREKLYEDLFARDLERLLVFGLQFHDCFRRLYFDGDPPKLSDAPQTLEDVVKRLPLDRHWTSWQHIHATNDAVNLFESLKQISLDGEEPRGQGA